jgi:hypothetical protein
MMVVVGYGGWDDIFTTALNSAMFEASEPLDVVWTFYESEPARIEYQYENLFENVSAAIGRGRFRPYIGIDCHTFLPRLLTYEAKTASQPEAAAAPATPPGTQPEAAAAPATPPGTQPEAAAAPATPPRNKRSRKQPKAAPVTRIAPISSLMSAVSASSLVPEQFLALNEYTQRLEEITMTFGGRADTFYIQPVRDVVINIYRLMMNWAFRSEGPLHREFHIRDIFKDSYSDLDDTLDIYEYTSRAFELMSSFSLQQQEDLVKARRKAVLSVESFYQTVSSIVDELHSRLAGRGNLE